MKYQDVRVGRVYRMQVSKKSVLGRVLRRNKMREQWWHVKNLSNGRILKIYDPSRFIEECEDGEEVRT